nr:MAG TPA: hypothetical protein [Caudoviricetes sp.]
MQVPGRRCWAVRGAYRELTRRSSARWGDGAWTGAAAYRACQRDGRGGRASERVANHGRTDSPPAGEKTSSSGIPSKA